MSVSRNFLIMGTVYLLIGVGFGMHMGASEDFTLAPLHAHINLLGFVLMTLFGLGYRVIPGMADGALAKAHFWLHQAGALVLMVGLFMIFTGRTAPGLPVPIMPIAEVLVFLGVVLWFVGLLRKA